MDDPVSIDSLKGVFFEECAERLDDLRDKLGVIGTCDDPMECLRDLFRDVHSIKAGAGAFDFGRLVEFSHVYENVLDHLRNGRVTLSDDVEAVLVQATDILGDLVAADMNAAPLDTGYEALITARLEAISPDDTGTVDGSTQPNASDDQVVEPSCHDQTAEGAATYKILFQPHQDLFRQANEPLLILRELGRLGQLTVQPDLSGLPGPDMFDPESCYLAWTLTLVTDAAFDDIESAFDFVMDTSRVEIEKQHEPEQKTTPDLPAVTDQKAQKTPQEIRVASIRVDLDRIDRLVNMVGELVISQSMVVQRVRDEVAGSDVAVLRELDDLTQRTCELQEGVMAIRMQPVKSAFMRMPRIVRDIAPRLGKSVRLVTEGEKTEVDKTVIEELSEPITHMVRNALDHGIETPAERLAAGKPEEGTIRLSAEHRSGHIVIKVSDDGKGLDGEKIRRKAVERGIVSPEAELSDQEMKDLIFAPGFSTADSVSDISGRGVGMDVVRRMVLTLGGRISVDSQIGQGSTFTLTLPLTLAVLDGMLVAVGTETFVLPISAIAETVWPNKTDLRQLSGGPEVLRVREEYVPVLPLGDCLGVQADQRQTEQSLIVIAETDTGSRIGLAVDDLLGQQQVVIKSLEDNYARIDGVAAATILGDGKVALILDVDGLARGLQPGLDPHLCRADAA